MVDVRRLARFLATEGYCQAGAGVLPGTAGITHVASIDEVRPGALSWLSARHAERRPDAVREFRGAALIVPEGAETANSHGAFIIPCRQPKRAFSAVVEELFPELLEDPMPRGGLFRHPAALVGADVALGPGVILGAGVVLGAGVRIGPYTVLAHTRVGAGAHIGAHCAIGLPGFGFERGDDGTWFRFPHIGRVEIGEGVEIGSCTCVDRGGLGATRIGDGAKVDNLVHIAHNVQIGNDSLVIANAMIAGSAVIGDRVWIAPSASVMNQVHVGEGSLVGLGAVVLKDVPAGVTVVGNPAHLLERKAGQK